MQARKFIAFYCPTCHILNVAIHWRDKHKTKKIEMKKNNKLEIIGFILLAIGVIWKVLGKFTENEIIAEYSSYFEILFFLGLAIWAFGLMKKQSKQKENKQNE